jgi:hypothetical protein
MSFDIFYMPCRFARAPVETVDPHTGQPRKMLPNEPLTAPELAAVRDVLTKANVCLAENGFAAARFPDGGYAEVHAHDLQHGCTVALRGQLTVDVLRFLFSVLQAGNWVMIPAMRETRAIATSPAAFKSVPSEYPKPVVCESYREIGLLLGKGFDAWQAYRDQVVYKSGENSSAP